MEIPHEDQSSHYDHEKDKFAYLSMRDRIELGKRQFNKPMGSKDALNEDMSMKAKLASMARRIEEFELRNVHTEAQPQAMPTSFEYINHPNLTSQPQHQPKDKFAYLSMRDRIELGKSKFNKANAVLLHLKLDNHPNLTTQPQPQPSMSYIFIGASHFEDKQSHGGLCRNQCKKIKESVEDRHFGGDCYDNSMDQPSIENHKVQDDKGLPEPLKHPFSREEKRNDSLDQMGRMPILFGIQGGFSMKYDACKIEMEVKQRKQGSQNA
ncbi:hypothetical protein CK203_112156 [Vitis vinifera]|uniref:Uncharacterized protein n=1 Tax=Vitis vinifera TaxID=29760 RepID=A0A438CBY8_VITVI|nr:hypothetical protein CK203_112156 [Vitis vinifera]